MSKVYSDPKNEEDELTYKGHPVTIDSVFLDGCQVVRPQLSLYNRCGYTYAVIKRWVSGTGACKKVSPKMYARRIRPDEVHTLDAIRV